MNFNWILLIELYVLTLVGALIHEFGHFGKIKISLIPFNSYAKNAKVSGFWAMIPELIVLVLIFYFAPSILFLQYLGFILYIHVIYSMIFGYFGFSLSRHKIQLDNYKNIFSLIVGIFMLLYFWHYYSQIGLNIWSLLIS